LGGTTLTDSSAVELCQGGGNLEELTMETDSEALMVAGVKLAQENWRRFRQEFGSATKIIPHQVGSTHRRAFQEALGIQDVPDFSTFPDYGNTGSAALPLTFIKAHSAGLFVAGDRVALTGIGSGLTSTMVALEFT
jgi:3-oxoacyl-[acyl-carrier-protein] synthase-3